jgi:hypothetical protein
MGLGKGKIFPSARFGLRTVQPVGSSFTDYTIPAAACMGALFCKENGICFFVVSWFDTIERRTSNNYVLLDCLVWSSSPTFSGHHIAVWLWDFVAEFCHPWRIFPVSCAENCSSRIALHISGLFHDTWCCETFKVSWVRRQTFCLWVTEEHVM